MLSFLKEKQDEQWIIDEVFEFYTNGKLIIKGRKLYYEHWGLAKICMYMK